MFAAIQLSPNAASLSAVRAPDLPEFSCESSCSAAQGPSVHPSCVNCSGPATASSTRRSLNDPLIFVGHQPVPHAGLGDQVPRQARVRLELLAQGLDVGAQAAAAPAGTLRRLPPRHPGRCARPSGLARARRVHGFHSTACNSASPVLGEKVVYPSYPCRVLSGDRRTNSDPGLP